MLFDSLQAHRSLLVLQDMFETESEYRCICLMSLVGDSSLTKRGENIVAVATTDVAYISN